MRSFRLRNGIALNSKTARLASQPRPQRARPKTAIVSPPSPDSFSRHLVIMVASGLPANGEAAETVRARCRYRFAAQTIFDRVGRDPRWQTTLAITPDSAVAGPYWPADAMRMAQGGGDIAGRIQKVLREMPPGPVVVIGTDAANVRPQDVWAAFAALGDADAVLGPGADGGFWLIGAKRRPSIPLGLSKGRWAGMATRASVRRALTGCAIEELAPLETHPKNRSEGRRVVAPFS